MLCADGRVRTCTVLGLSQVPLPVGLHLLVRTLLVRWQFCDLLGSLGRAALRTASEAPYY